MGFHFCVQSDKPKTGDEPVKLGAPRCKNCGSTEERIFVGENLQCPKCHTVIELWAIGSERLASQHKLSKFMVIFFIFCVFESMLYYIDFFWFDIAHLGAWIILVIPLSVIVGLKLGKHREWFP